MASIEDKQDAERRMVQLLEDNGLPPADEIEYGHGCVRFLWHDRKLAVVVDIDDPESLQHGGQ